MLALPIVPHATSFPLFEKFLENGDIVHGIDNISDYYDVNLKNARLNMNTKPQDYI